MPNSYQIKQKLKRYLAERNTSTLESYLTKVQDLFADQPKVQVTHEKLVSLIQSGYLITTSDQQLIPEELLKLDPTELVTLDQFAHEAELTVEEVKNLVEEGQIKSLDLGIPLIPRLELRHYWREHDQQVVYQMDDLLQMLDHLFRDERSWWDQFWSNRQRRVPFFLEVPDENLVENLAQGTLQPQRVLELGCGNGRNAVYLAEQGCQVTGVDLSQEALQWGRDAAQQKGVQLELICDSIFAIDFEEGSYDLVYDSGCFHHILPHRRFSYLELVKSALKPGGYLSINCFKHDNAGANGPDYSDWEIYKHRWSGSGMAFSRHQLEMIFGDDFEMIQFRQMKEIEQPSDTFGVPYMWTVLLRRR